MAKRTRTLPAREITVKGKRVVLPAVILPDIDLDEEEVYLDDGTRLTEELAARMGAEAAERARARRGRPSISPTAGRSPTLTVRVDPAVRSALERLAKRQGRRVAEVTREAIAEYLNRHAG